MITIVKDNTVKRVTIGQYENLFKQLGYEIKRPNVQKEVHKEVIVEKPKKKGDK